ncbi:hypothetical protein ACFW53_20685 [Nocardiopsis dassonvillei]|uniref:hypothetical protein n=1 Tax=Nocardiopsis dassonvillei TaxID=2014 RepID=UPI0036721FD0
MDHSKIPHFPKITADITDPAAGKVTVNGVGHTVTGEGEDELRQAVIEYIAATAAKVGRPVRAATTDAQGTWPLIVHPDGTVEQDSTVTVPKPAVVKASKRKGRPPAIEEPAPAPDASPSAVEEPVEPPSPVKHDIDIAAPPPETPAPAEPATMSHALAPVLPLSTTHSRPPAPRPPAGRPAPPTPEPAAMATPSSSAPPSVHPPPRPVALPAPDGRDAGQATTHASWTRSVQLWEEAIDEHNRARGFYRPVRLNKHPGPRAVDHAFGYPAPARRAPMGSGY